MATIIIQRLDGTVYDLDAMGFRVKKFDIPPQFLITNSGCTRLALHILVET